VGLSSGGVWLWGQQVAGVRHWSHSMTPERLAELGLLFRAFDGRSELAPTIHAPALND
jgi:hypothetical protein